MAKTARSRPKRHGHHRHRAAATAAKKAFADARAVAAGVMLARDLVNEPANVLGPVEFAGRAKELEALGVEVEVLTEKEMKKLGMGALLGVGQGSRAAAARWWSCSGTAASRKDKPVAFVGKGVVFDTGGISIKPAAGMEDMKGDMGGAAAVTGLMLTLAARKAKVNAVGIVGCVENMPSTATRSGRATSSPRCRARPSRSSTPTPRAASCWPTRSGTPRTASSRSSWSTWRR